MKMRYFMALALSAMTMGNAGLAAATPDNAPVVKTDRGQISGARTGKVAAFLGVPYAAPPIGDDRWRAPQPAAAWHGVRPASQFGPSCPQAIVPGGFGPWTQEYVPSGEISEDCLSLNIWTPKIDRGAKLPVLMWVHGGGFTSGSASVPVYDGAHLAHDGIVVVSINYRLGLLGFLGSSEFRDNGGGNFGLQDQLAALRWVKRNIAAFGGDPQQVTIAGQSAGAASVHALILSPLARGLFQRAIPQSGIGLGLPPSLGLPSRDVAEKGAAAFLNAAGVKSIAEARALTLAQVRAAFIKTGGQPGVIDAPRPTPYADGAVLPLDPTEAFAKGRYNDTPVLIGLTADEGSGLNAQYRVSDSAQYSALLSRRLGTLAPEFAAAYPTATPETSFPALIRDGGLVSVLNWNHLRAKTSRFPLYSYMWTHVEPGPKSAIYGAFHTSEVPYVFQTLDKAPDRNFTAQDRHIATITSRYWINFVKTGDPNGTGLPIWPRFGKNDETINLGADFGPYPTLDPRVVHLFERHLSSGKSLLVF